MLRKCWFQYLQPQLESVKQTILNNLMESDDGLTFFPLLPRIGCISNRSILCQILKSHSFLSLYLWIDFFDWHCLIDTSLLNFPFMNMVEYFWLGTLLLRYTLYFHHIKYKQFVSIFLYFPVITGLTMKVFLIMVHSSLNVWQCSLMFLETDCPLTFILHFSEAFYLSGY